MPILDCLLRLYELRNERAAHARRSGAPGEPITYYELMEAQAVVRVALLQALDARCRPV